MSPTYCRSTHFWFFQFFWLSASTLWCFYLTVVRFHWNDLLLVFWTFVVCFLTCFLTRLHSFLWLQRTHQSPAWCTIKRNVRGHSLILLFISFPARLLRYLTWGVVDLMVVHLWTYAWPEFQVVWCVNQASAWRLVDLSETCNCWDEVMRSESNSGKKKNRDGIRLVGPYGLKLKCKVTLKLSIKWNKLL